MHMDGVTGSDWICCQDAARHHFAVDRPGNRHMALVRARCETTRNRNGLLDCHAGDKGVLAGRSDFTHDEEGPVAINLDGHIWTAQVGSPQTAGDGGINLVGGMSARCNLANEGKVNAAGLIDLIDVAEVFLVEHGNAKPITAIHLIGRDEDLMKGGWRALIATTGGKQGAQNTNAEAAAATVDESGTVHPHKSR